MMQDKMAGSMQSETSPATDDISMGRETSKEHHMALTNLAGVVNVFLHLLQIGFDKVPSSAMHLDLRIRDYTNACMFDPGI